jgi:carboxylate-amine ligase
VTFGQTAPWSLGVEEELMLVDAATLEPAPAFSRLVLEDGERIKPEVFECLVEIATPAVGSAPEILAELRTLRAEIGRRATAQGLAVHAAGMHATARGRQALVPRPRYEAMLAELGDGLYRQLVCGLHVHVSVPEAETCLRAFEGVVPWLPALLSLSASSPFADGAATGLLSERSRRLLEMPTGGTPPFLRTWADWVEATQGDDRRRHWDAWPRPAYGTLEVRVMDQQADVRRSAGFAALVQALVATVAGREHEPYDREAYACRRAEAAASVPVGVEELARLVEPRARELGGWELARLVLETRPEAQRQLELGPAGAVRDAVARSLDFDA